MQRLGAVHVALGDFSCTLEPRPYVPPLLTDDDPLLADVRDAGQYRKKQAQQAMSEEDARAPRLAVERELFASSEGS
jgi:hypothetical protein